MAKTNFIAALVLITVGCSAVQELRADRCRIKPVEVSITKKDGTTLKGVMRVNSKQTTWQIRNDDGVFFVPSDEVLEIDVHTQI